MIKRRKEGACQTVAPASILTRLLVCTSGVSFTHPPPYTSLTSSSPISEQIATCGYNNMEPQFHSQHSHEVLNVSEDHYSSIPCSPKVEKSAKTQVDRSPAISQHEHREPDTAERVDDSYERSPLRDRAPRSQTPFDADDDENLYCVSPKGKAKLDARIATISAQKKRVRSSACAAPDDLY